MHKRTSNRSSTIVVTNIVKCPAFDIVSPQTIPMIQAETGFLSSHDNFNLYYQVWKPKQPIHACLAIAHGFGGHSGQYDSTAIVFANQGIATYALDFRGHGQSPGQRGYIDHWSDYISDLETLIRHMATQHPAIPRFLWGHSMGGVIALDFILHTPENIQGLLLTAPAVGENGISTLKLMLGKLLSKIWPRFSLPSGLDVNGCSRDLAITQAYRTDPLRHSVGTARLSTEFTTAVHRVNQKAATIRTPILILHGGGDPTTNPEDSRALFGRLTCHNRQWKEYPSAYHELYLDINRDEVLTDMLNWMNTIISASEQNKTNQCQHNSKLKVATIQSPSSQSTNIDNPQ